MHALVTPVLLRLPRLDAVDRDAEPEPPNGKLAKIEESIVRSKGHAVVGADRQSALIGEPLESRESQDFTGRFERFAQQQIARGMVGDGERIAVDLIAELKLALVIGTPQIVGLSAL